MSISKYFNEIVNEYKDRVYNTCLSLVKNEEDAEDLAQEVFIEVFKNHKNYKGNSSLFTWIYRISVNKSLEFIRKNSRLKRSGVLTSLQAIENIESVTFYHPGVRLENKESAAIIFRAINLLSDEQKVAFTLNKVEGLSNTEIADIMNKSVSAVEALIHRAKLKLREILKEYHEKV